jgi:hypothetical protein
MSRSDECETLNFTLLRIGIDKILNSVGKSALKEMNSMLGNNSLDKKYYYHHPDVLCTILRIMYGKSYLKMIRSI